MPTYEYRCAQGHHFELFQRISDPAADKCPQCGAVAERQLSSGAGLIFKGSGFYITDYRSDTYKKAAQADSGPAKTEGGSGSAQGDSVASSPSAKPENKPASGGSSAKD